jgi:GT2 family glycosyltransferase
VISLVLVSYRSAALAAAAIESARGAARALGQELEVVTVVNSDDESEARALAPLSDGLVVPRTNLGFSGGLNRGVAASKGEVLALANPDIVLTERALAALLEGLARHGRAAVGPAFFWDDGETLLLPAAEEPRPADLVRRLLAPYEQRGAGVFRRDLSRARRELERVRADETAPVTGLIGALVLTRRTTYDAVGPFDEGYPLYYEENDWQRRLRALGGVLLRARGARVVHRFNQSARLEPKAAGWFATGERRYFLSHFGPRGARALERLAAQPTKERRMLALRDGLEWRGRAQAVVVSPHPYFRPFAYTEVDGSRSRWDFPTDVLAGVEGSWYARAVDRTGATLAEGERFVPPPS